MKKKHLKTIVGLALGLLALAGCGTPEDFAKADNMRTEAQLHAEATRVAIGAEATRVAVQAEAKARLELDRQRAAQELKTKGEVAAQELKNRSDLAAQDLKAKTDFGILEANQAATLSAIKANEAKTLAKIEADRANAVAQAQTAWVGPVTVAIVGSLSALALVALAWGMSRAIVIKAYVKAATIWPNKAGQLPLIQTGGPGWKAIVDPNRSPGPVTTFNTPSLVERLRGRPDQLPALEVKTPLQLSEAGHLQLAAQATAGQMVAAATRHKEATAPANVNDAVRSVATTTIAAPLPALRRIDPSHVEALLELTEGEVIDQE